MNSRIRHAWRCDSSYWQQNRAALSRAHTASTNTRLLFLLFALVASVAVAEEITFRADAMTGVAGSKTSRTTLNGNAFVKTASMEISADSIELDGDDFRFITATGAVVGKNIKTNMDFTCGTMRYDRDTEVARLEDSVHLVDNENAVTTDAQLIEYNQNSEIAIMQIGVTLKQKDNTCTSAYAVYRKKEQLLEMSGNPKIVQGDDTFRAQEIMLNLDTQEITLDGRVSGTVTDSKQRDDNAVDTNDGTIDDSAVDSVATADDTADVTNGDAADANTTAEKAAEGADPDATAEEADTLATDSASSDAMAAEIDTAEHGDNANSGDEGDAAPNNAATSTKSKKRWGKKK